MKLKNKLLSIAAGATIVSAAAPLITLSSCGNTAMTEYDFVNKEYEYDGDMPVGLTLNSTSATAAFYKAATEQDVFVKEILSSGYAKYLVQKVKLELMGENNEITECKVKISNPVIGKTTISYPGEEPVTYPTVSFKMTYSYKYHYEEENTKNEDTIYYEEKEYSCTKEYVNIPFGAYTSSFEYDDEIVTKWFVGIGDTFARCHDYIFRYIPNTWAINVSESSKTTEWTSETEGSKQVKESNTTYNINTYQKISSLMESYYNASSETREEISDLFFFDFCSNYLWLSTYSDEILSDYATSALHLTYNAAPAGSYDVTIAGFAFNGKPHTYDNWTLNLTEALHLSYLNGHESSNRQTYKLNLLPNAKIVVKDVFYEGDYYYSTAEIKGTVTYDTSKENPIPENSIGNEYLSFRLPRMLPVINSTTGEKLDVYTDTTYIGGYVKGTPTITDGTFASNAVALPVTCSFMNSLKQLNDYSRIVDKNNNIYTVADWKQTSVTGGVLLLTPNFNPDKGQTYTFDDDSYIMLEGSSQYRISLAGVEYTVQ